MEGHADPLATDGLDRAGQRVAAIEDAVLAGELGAFDHGACAVVERRLEEAFASRTRDDWAAHFADRDACVTPVLTFSEAPRHPHNVARGVFVEVDGIVQPAAAPRFSRTPGAVRSGADGAAAGAVETLGAWGVKREDVLSLVESGVVRG